MYNFQLSADERDYWMSLALSRNEMERGEADEREAVYWSGQTLQEMQSSVRKPMSMAVDAIKHLLRGLQAGDKVSVIVFADKSHTLFTEDAWASDPDRCVDDLDALLDQQLPVEIGSGTRMGSALRSAEKLVTSSTSNATINRIIVISDGIVQDDRASMEALETINEAGYAVTTLGVGDEFDEEFLMRVADTTRGAYYYAADIQDITEQLLQELTVIKATTIQQLYVSASGVDGSMVQDVFMVVPYMTIFEEMESGGGWVRAKVGDLPSNTPTRLLVQIAPALQPEGIKPVAEIELTWHEADEEFSQATTIAASFSDNPAVLGERNAEIQEMVDRFNVYKYEREAQRAQSKGDIVTAREKLGAATRELHKLGEMALAQDVEAQIAALGSPDGDQDPSRIKRIKATTRRLGEKQAGATRQLTPKE
jgi:Ca-activated chloride channel family protein